MSMSDPIADLLTRIRNACMAKRRTVDVPASKLKSRILDVLEREGYIAGTQAVEGVDHPMTRVYLRYHRHQPVIQHIQRVSTPGLRRYAKADALGRVCGGIGIAIISTSEGVMTDRDARRKRLGGEVLAVVW